MKMKILFTGVAMIALSACAGQQLSKAEKTTPRGSEFEKSLSSGYLRLAQDEFKEADYGDADYFARRSITAGGGTSVPLPEVTERNLPKQDAIYVATAREELATVLDGSARQKAPKLAAMAQVAYECWIQELEENRQPDHIAACRDELDGLIPALRNAIAVAPAPVVVKEKPAIRHDFRILFATGSAELNSEGRAAVSRAASVAQKIERVRVVVTGHTDTVGSLSANQKLSKRRAEVVAAALRVRGVSRDAITAQFDGEEKLAVSTSDGVAEVNNRRVEISISQTP